MVQTIGSFGWAIDKIKDGVKVTRKRWSGKDRFIYYVAGNSYPVSGSPSSTVKGVFKDDIAPYGAYIAMKTTQGISVRWLATSTDMLAEDWEEI